jgi:hypothetical protein
MTLALGKRDIDSATHTKLFQGVLYRRGGRLYDLLLKAA